MLSRRFLLCVGVSAVVAAAALPGPVRANEFGQGAERFILKMAERAIADLTSKEESRPARVERFRTLMYEYFAVKGIAQWVLGRHWPRATPEQQNEYLKLYEDLMIATYVDRFTAYQGERLVIVRTAVIDGKDAVVHSVISRPNTGEPIKVEWRVRAKGGEYKVVDIMVEGVSMGQAQRSEFASVINQYGGDVDAFLKVLRKRVQVSAS